MKILIIEDEKDLSMALSELLECEGFQTDCAYNGVDGLDQALTKMYDIIVLDVTLPKMNGFDILKNIRANNVQSAVLMLTAKSEIEDKVRGLESGADDYLTKPFITDEFLARIHALSRRNCMQYSGDRISYNDIFLDTSGHILQRDEMKIELSVKEYGVLEMLMRNPGVIIPKERFVEKIWGYDSDAEYNSIEVYVSFIRKKLKILNSCVTIKAVRGAGYTLEAKNAE